MAMVRWLAANFAAMDRSMLPLSEDIDYCILVNADSTVVVVVVVVFELPIELPLFDVEIDHQC